MTKRMGDSTNSWDIPQNVDMAAGYVNGAYAWSPLAWARWLGKPTKHITVNAANVGDVLDVERYDALPWEAPEWVVAARARGVAEPWVYLSLSLWAATRNEFHLRGVPEPQWWIADYDNDPAIPAGAVAKQYANAVYTHGHYDLSSVSDAAFGGEHEGGSSMNLTDVKGVLIAAAHGVGRGATVSQTDIDASAARYMAGTPLDVLVAEVVSTPDAKAYEQGVAALLAAPPSTPDNDSAYALKTHVHTVEASKTGPSQ